MSDLTFLDYFNHFNNLTPDTWYSISQTAKRDPDAYRKHLRDFHDCTGRVTISDDQTSFKLSPPIIADKEKGIFFKY